MTAPSIVISAKAGIQLAGLRVQQLDPDFRRGDGMKRSTNYRIPGESRNARDQKPEGKP
jgi:hypothetical protein